MRRSRTPKEWFVVPLDLVEEAVTRILDRSIVNYRYDGLRYFGPVTKDHIVGAASPVLVFAGR